MSEELEDKVRWLEHQFASFQHDIEMDLLPPVTAGIKLGLAPLMSSNQQDWRTPRELFQKIQAVAGPFDLDAAADRHNTLCEMFFSEDYSALVHEWAVYVGDAHTRVWLNPPYGKALPLFAARAVAQVTGYKSVEVWMLVPARVDTRWWNALMTKAVSVRFMKGRVKFEREDGARDSAPFPTAVIQLRHDGGKPEVFWGWKP
jgi:phage N-6-adenine-methyltransferase